MDEKAGSFDGLYCEYADVIDYSKGVIQYASSMNDKQGDVLAKCTLPQSSLLHVASSTMLSACSKK